MRSVGKWLVRIVGGLLALLILAVGVVYAVSSSKLSRTWDIKPETVAIPTDSASIALGKHVAVIRGCTGCHTPTLAGETFADAPIFGRLWARNLTRGKGGAGSRYTDADWIRAIRHGVRPDGHALLFMPSQEFNILSDRDLGAVIAYMKSVPPVDTMYPDNSVGPLGRALFLAGVLPLVPAQLIAHDAPRPAEIPVEASPAYGRYLAIGCVGCHGETFSGGKIPGAPDMRPARNITPDMATGIGAWTAADLQRLLRTGHRPDGSMIDTVSMPVPMTRELNDIEINAVYAYLHSLPAKKYGGR